MSPRRRYNWRARRTVSARANWRVTYQRKSRGIPSTRLRRVGQMSRLSSSTRVRRRARSRIGWSTLRVEEWWSTWLRSRLHSRWTRSWRVPAQRISQRMCCSASLRRRRRRASRSPDPRGLVVGKMGTKSKFEIEKDMLMMYAVYNAITRAGRIALLSSVSF